MVEAHSPLQHNIFHRTLQEKNIRDVLEAGDLIGHNTVNVSI
jgi:hypothetical protein